MKVRVGFCIAGTVAILSDGSGEEYVVEEARVGSSALGCYAYKLGGPAAGGLSSLLPNISGEQLFDRYSKLLNFTT